MGCQDAGWQVGMEQAGSAGELDGDVMAVETARTQLRLWMMAGAATVTVRRIEELGTATAGRVLFCNENYHEIVTDRRLAVQDMHLL